MGLRRPNPSGNGIFAAAHRRCVSHNELWHCSFLASRSAAKLLVAIGAAGSSEVP
jgi:hypothetical protein